MKHFDESTAILDFVGDNRFKLEQIFPSTADLSTDLTTVFDAREVKIGANIDNLSNLNDLDRG